jgi:TRAP-type mannitol/chloroaromatic compound transport system substrate-binding protein
MNRRALMGAAVAAAPVALATPALAQTLPEVRWRAQSSFPRVFDVLYGTMERIAQRVGQLTDGRFRIQTFPAGEIVGGLQVLDAVQAGTLECGHTASYYYIGKDNAFAPFTAMSFGLNTRQMTVLVQGSAAATSWRTSSSANTTSSPTPPATPARRWAAGSATRSPRSSSCAASSSASPASPASSSRASAPRRR